MSLPAPLRTHSDTVQLSGTAQCALDSLKKSAPEVYPTLP